MSPLIHFFQSDPGPVRAYLHRALYRKKKAMQAVNLISQGLRVWRQSEPIHRDDTDLVVNSSLHDIEPLIEMNKRMVVALDYYAEKEGGDKAKECLLSLSSLING